MFFLRLNKKKFVLFFLVSFVAAAVGGFLLFRKYYPNSKEEIIINQEAGDDNGGDSTNRDLDGADMADNAESDTVEIKNAETEIDKTADVAADTGNTTIEDADKKINTDLNTDKNDDEKDVSIKNRLVSWGYAKSSGREIDTIVIHSSYDALGNDPYDVDGLIDEYKQYGVSAHYLIDRKGKIYRLVEDKNIAYHAGVSEMPDGRTGVNNFSIGIELMNTKDDEYTKAQYSALNGLIDYLKEKYDIDDVLGHDDIAPDRKTDPWNFDWKKI